MIEGWYQQGKSTSILRDWSSGGDSTLTFDKLLIEARAILGPLTRESLVMNDGNYCDPGESLE
jgi:hypothetical protein